MIDHPRGKSGTDFGGGLPPSIRGKKIKGHTPSSFPLFPYLLFPFIISKKNSDPTPVVTYCIIRTTIMVADKCSDNLHHTVLLGQRAILYDSQWRVPFSATTL